MVDKKIFYKDPAVSSLYDETRFGTSMGLRLHAIELSMIKSILKKNQSILELACGTGRLLKSLREEGWSVSGVEQSISMLEAGAINNKPYIIVGDVFHLPLASGVYDAAYSFRFTNHYSDLSQFIAEAGRVLKSGGEFIFDSMRWSPLLWNVPQWGGRNYLASDEKIKGWLRKSGFAVVAVHPLFLVSPYLLARCPAMIGKIFLKVQSFFPKSLFAVAVWHVQKVS